MAKLKAHGYEVARLSRQWEPEDKNVWLWERDTLSFRSDGHIMRKHDARHAASKYRPEENQTWGWKLYLKVKKGADHDKTFKSLIARFIDKGYTVEFQDRSLES